MPPKYVDHDQYRRELLHQCFELVAERGYSAITMRQLAAHLGVSMGTLYHYFKDKQALFEQLVEEIARQNAPPQDALIQLSETTREPTESLAALLSEVEQNKSHYLKQLFITADFHRLQASDTDHPSNVLQVAGEGYRQAITQVIGLSDPVMATLIRSMINGLVMEQMFGDNTVTFDEKAHLFVEMLSAYLNQEAEGTKPKG
jgi:AcrR family transcriptional regulator